MHRVLACFLVVSLSVTPPISNLGDIAICSVTEKVKEKNLCFTGYYPRFFGIGDNAAQKSLNVQMQELAHVALARTKAAAAQLTTGDRSEQQRVEGTFGYEVKRNSNGVVSLLLSDTLYTAKENTKQNKYGITFKVSNGEILKLANLFQNTEEGIHLVDREIEKQLDNRKLKAKLQKATPQIHANQPFYLTDDSLVIIVPEMTWFGREMGTVEFPVSFDTLKECFIFDFVP